MKILIKELRMKEKFNEIPKKAGLYKWYANEDTTKQLLGDYFNDLKNHLTKGVNKEVQDFYVLYVGKSKKDLQERLKKHVNGSIDNSTLRHSIASLIGTQVDEDAINNILDKMYVEYEIDGYTTDNVESKEKAEIKNMSSPLNIDDNDLEVLKLFIAYLQKRRTLLKKQ